MKQVSQVLRAAMVEAEKQGISLYRMAKACDLDDSIVYRFYHDECGLALSSVDRLCQFLGLELTQGKTIGTVASKSATKKTAKKKATKATKPAKKKKSKKKATRVKATKKKATKKKATKKTAKKKKSRRSSR